MNTDLMTKLIATFMEHSRITQEEAADLVARTDLMLQDAGYVNLSDRGGLIHTTVVDSRGKTENMTGQEFYDRFDKEFKKTETTGASCRDVYEAAKRAAGLAERAK